MAEIYERCVIDAPNRDWRETLFSALTSYLAVLARLIPHGVGWIDGGFTTAKAAAPFDVDVVIHPAHWPDLNALDEKDQAALMGAVTIQDAIVGSPVLGYLPRIQPVCGALDSFLCTPGNEQY